jgi:uncharacterized protein YjbJ (UPF0337 family)
LNEDNTCLEDVMSEDRFAGTARNMGGKVQEGVGKLTGDTVTELKGKVNEAVGAAQETYGKAADAVKDTANEAADYIATLVKERPYTVAVSAFFLGWVIAHVTAHRRDYY